jgi:hypothetical protein
MAYPIVRTDLLAGTVQPALLRSVKYFDGDEESTNPINNGSVLKLTGIANPDTDREVWVGVDTAADDTLASIVLIATPELIYDKKYKNLDGYVNVPGSILRGYRLVSGDIFSVTADGFTVDGTPAKGFEVGLQAGNKFTASATAAGTKIGEIIQIEQIGSSTYYVVQVS